MPVHCWFKFCIPVFYWMQTYMHVTSLLYAGHLAFTPDVAVTRWQHFYLSSIPICSTTYLGYESEQFAFMVIATDPLCHIT